MVLNLCTFLGHRVVPTDIGNIEVAPGGLDFCLKFPYKVKIVKIKSSSWTKLYIAHERAIKTEKNDTILFLFEKAR